MSDTAGLDLVKDGDDFILSVIVINAKGRRRKSKVRLTEDQVLTLAQSSSALRGDILLRRNPATAGIDAVLVTPVARIGLSEDAIGQNLLLTLAAPNGGRLTFQLSVPIAELLMLTLGAELADLKEKMNNRTQN
jgi:hypothetical protein